jgi:hypothetical protein
MEIDKKFYFTDNDGGYRVAEIALPGVNPLGLHFSMF